MEVDSTTDAGEILRTDPHQIALEDLSQPSGIVFEKKCKICNSPFVKLVNHLLKRGLTDDSIAAYFNEYEIDFSIAGYKGGNKALTADNLAKHKKHIVLSSSLEEIEALTPKQIDAALADLEEKPIKAISEEIFRRSAIPFMKGQIPTTADAYKMSMAAKSIKEEQDREDILTGLFKAAGKDKKEKDKELSDGEKLVALATKDTKGSVKEKQTVTFEPVKGVKVSKETTKNG